MNQTSYAWTKGRDPSRFSVAMTGEVDRQLVAHLVRNDGQEDLCMAVYQPSSGATRLTALVTKVILPEDGDTTIRGTVSFTGNYVLRVVEHAAAAGGGVVILHSHPRGTGWQPMSGPDRDAEGSYANLVREITGLPLVGMTLAGATGRWSGRFWARGVGTSVTAVPCENIRVIDEQLRTSWNPVLSPAPRSTATQVRSVSCWGPRLQADIARLRVLVVGSGTVGIDVALRLAATGLQSIAVMDFDTMKLINLDRIIGATALDVWLNRSKVEVAGRLLRRCATAETFHAEPIQGSVCEPDQFEQALDYDLIFCCIDDHPWPRSVLNTLPYTDLIPVIDGGIHVDAFDDGEGMRNATWRSHVLRPGRPCMACNGQIDLGKVQLDRDGLMENAAYIAGLPPADRPQSQNVAVLAVSATASLLAQFASFVAAPAGIGEPGPLRYSLSTHDLEHVAATTRKHCPVEASTLAGDRRQVLLGEHDAARAEVDARDLAARHPTFRVLRVIADHLAALLDRCEHKAKQRLSIDGPNRRQGRS